MKPHLRALLCAAGLSFAICSPSLADGLPSGDKHDWDSLRVGRTGILCYQAPCPWYGIARADQSIGPQSLLWSGDRLPTMRGSAEDRAYLRENYSQGCTRVEGRFRDGLLEVARILGSC